MKTLILIVLPFLFFTFVSTGTTFAQGKGEGIHTPGTGIMNPEMKEQGSGQGLSSTPTAASQTGTQSQMQDQDRLQQFIQDQDKTMQQDRMHLQERDQLIYQDQNRTVLGAEFLQEVQKTIPDVNPSLAQVGQQIQQSTQTTIKAEQQLRSRNQFMKFFFGSDQQAAAQLEQTASQNKQRLQQVTQLANQCPCDAQVKNMIQKQVQMMTQEQNRLLQLASKEKQNKGIFNWG
jgi:hypothetical protein